jgi:broad specificity phosphatase PhoE
MSRILEHGPELDIYLVRHGQSTANAEKVMQGWADYPLSEEGILQARIAGRYLQTTGVPIKAIYSSPLSRARRTAEEIGRRFIPPLKVELLDDLKEIDIGTLTDMPIADAKTEYPDFFSERKSELDEFERFGGETLGDFTQRIEDGLIKLFDKHVDGDSIIITAHGGSAIMVFRQLFDIEPSRRLLKPHNCYLAKIERRFVGGQYFCQLSYFLSPLQQQLMLEGIGYTRGLAEEEENDD